MKDLGVKYVNLIGDNGSAVKLAKAMDQIGYKPEIFDVTQEQYSANYVSNGGSSVDGSSVILPHPLFTDAGSHPELALYTQWLQQVSPGADPTTTGLFSWSAARMFVREAIALGGKLTRASMLTRVRSEHAWTANGLHTAEDVGAKRPGKCALVIKLFGTTWKQISPKGYICGSIIQF